MPLGYVLAYGSIILVLAILVFGRAVSFDFIAEYDDQFYLIDNPIFNQPSFDGFLSLFTTFRLTDYLPILYTSFYLDRLIWGQNPAGFHITNIVLHGANSMLLFLFLSKFIKRHHIAFFVAVVFLIHPVQVESVAWIPERKNLLVLFFLLLAAYQFRFKHRNGLGVLSYACALLSKSLAVVFPGLFLLSPLATRKTVGTKTIAIVAAMALTVACLTLVSQSSVGAIKPYHGGTFLNTVVLMGQTYWFYLYSLLTGRGLSPLHSVPETNVFLGLGFYAAAILTVFYLWHRKDHFMLGAIFTFFLFLLPVSNIVPIAVLQADRYLYIPVAIFFLAVFVALDRLWDKVKTPLPLRGTWIFGVLACLCYIPATLEYLPVYKDAKSMWAHVEKDPVLIGIARYNLGVVHEKEGDTISAAGWYGKAIDATGHCRATNNLAALLFEEGMFEKAHGLFSQAVDRCPSDPGLLFNLGLSYLKRNDKEKGRYYLATVAAEDIQAPQLAVMAKAIMDQIDEDEHRSPYHFREQKE